MTCPDMRSYSDSNISSLMNGVGFFSHEYDQQKKLFTRVFVSFTGWFQ